MLAGEWSEEEMNERHRKSAFMGCLLDIVALASSNMAVSSYVFPRGGRLLPFRPHNDEPRRRAHLLSIRTYHIP